MKASPDNPVNFARRNLFKSGAARQSNPIRPPWTDENRLVLSCTQCNACLNACPENVLKTGQGGFPEFDPMIGSGMCTFCGACADACPTPVFDKSRKPAWLIKANIEMHACLTYAGVHCSTCRGVCDFTAIQMKSRVGGPPRPELIAINCNGCGACVSACPGNVISLSPETTESTAV